LYLCDAMWCYARWWIEVYSVSKPAIEAVGQVYHPRERKFASGSEILVFATGSGPVVSLESLHGMEFREIEPPPHMRKFEPLTSKLLARVVP
jgi:hypothetical protein